MYCLIMYKIRHYYSLGLFLMIAGLFFQSCSADRRIARAMKRTFNTSQVIKQYQVGFALYDISGKQMIFERNAEKYFTPASNTKLFTFYAGLKLLSDSIPSLRYVERGDSLIFWGTGDPSFLQAELKGVRALDFLRQSDKKLFFAAGRYTGDFYGKGWGWDDYNAYYQAEINELPIQGNLLHVTERGGKPLLTPRLLSDCVLMDSGSKSRNFTITRDFNENKFHYPKVVIPKGYSQDIPFRLSTNLTLQLLTDTLNKPVEVIRKDMPATAKTIYNMKTDSVLRAMMLPSDNFIAEQLLLVYADRISPTLSAEVAIGYIQKKYLSELPDVPRWVDGSGLSRGNLFTPRDMVAVLDSIYVTIHDDKRLFSLLPAGGKTGTLKNAYPKTDQPFVYGKTGSLSNNHNQSGYVLTNKGKIFIFSFMNNNFVLPTAEVRKEMVRIITYIHEKY
ncbi:D-alanyl-D-alanine carboxypeptidase/D-alanyl-D-alanine-endopeptidase (penicillin-binding protein 4) [Pedobacter duraquae]|uniref:D-alanyl-D-alanine carboxypeptidase/D-alanyl-D-alanine-endopeptidase (Penicillin-binding protein 4) n=2 Tax=Pedobacter duraquae TaxID=425511 RepID=A0A4V3C2Q0_9SPHI|nr:D-alanyl-D-alanine carboxypeptidase/D-alanyl-D-alanine-endopeptidase (penicillin-binding protein 4) [Pedobacter duraquae]